MIINIFEFSFITSCTPYFFLVESLCCYFMGISFLPYPDRFSCAVNVSINIDLRHQSAIVQLQNELKVNMNSWSANLH